MSKPWVLVGVVVACAAVGGAYVMLGPPNKEAEAANSETHESSPSLADEAAQVEVVKPLQGGLERTTTQPGSVIPDKYAELFAKVSGYLKVLNVDIGSRVKEGDLLAVIDVPEVHKEVERIKARLDQAKAEVKQAESRLRTRNAEWKAAEAFVKKYEAQIEDCESLLSFRTKVYDRLSDLAINQRAVDMKLVDEKEEHMHAAQAALHAAEAALLAGNAEVYAALARIDEAKADLVDAEAKVEVWATELAKAQVFADYTTIYSPYTGVITARNFWPGDFVQSRNDGGAHFPLLTVEKTDVMRVKVQVPDADVPFTNPGDPATVNIDALPGRHFEGKVSRIASAEDPETRTMRIEIDLDNKHGLFRDGMYGKVTVNLEKAPDGLNIPSSCVVEELGEGEAVLYVARNNIARKIKVRIGADDGIRTEILSGLQPNDLVISSRAGISDGMKVSVIEHSGDEHAKAGHH